MTGGLPGQTARLFAFGDAPFLGSLGSIDATATAPIVGLAPTKTGKGCWLVAADGSVYAFGDAVYAGGLTGDHLLAPVIGVVPSLSSRGYRLAADGMATTFGDISSSPTPDLLPSKGRG